MYFTINSALNHYMSIFGFSSKDMSPKQLLTHKLVLDIFLNDSSRSMLLSNQSSPILPLNPPNTLLKMFQSISSQSPHSPNSPFSPIMKHTSNEKPRKGLFLQRLPATEAMSASEIPNTKEAKLVSAKTHGYSIVITVITILGVAVYLYNTCSKMTFFKGYLYMTMFVLCIYS